VNTIWTIT